jgi:hypothetical protein
MSLADQLFPFSDAEEFPEPSPTKRKPAPIVDHPDWEVGADGQPLRTESAHAAKLEADLGLVRQHSDHFRANQCLIDSLLQALADSGEIVYELSREERKDICYWVRGYLMQAGLATGRSMLEHDIHLTPIFDYLRFEPDFAYLWTADIQYVELICNVFDRFDGRVVEGEHGDRDILPEPAPVVVKAACDWYPNLLRSVQVNLYANTDTDGSGWHYEWLSAGLPARCASLNKQIFTFPKHLCCYINVF